MLSNIGFGYWFREPKLKLKTAKHWFWLLVAITKVKVENHMTLVLLIGFGNQNQCTISIAFGSITCFKAKPGSGTKVEGTEIATLVPLTSVPGTKVKTNNHIQFHTTNLEFYFSFNLPFLTFLNFISSYHN